LLDSSKPAGGFD